MTNLLTVLPAFDIRPYTHLLPSLEKALVSTADLLSLHALDVARRAQLPAGEVRKLSDAVLEALHVSCDSSRESSHGGGHYLSTLDDALDARLAGGIAPACLTEIVGESAVGKTQFLLTLLLSVQLPPPRGLGKSALYISTEAPLQTTRLAQILDKHPLLADLPPTERPSLSRIHSTHLHDVEAQEHILRYQVPVAIKQQNVGLLIIDSIAANYRAEFDKNKARNSADAFAKRNHQLTQLGALLRDIARQHNVAIVLANQVADRITPSNAAYQVVGGSTSQSTTQRSRPGSPPRPQTAKSTALSQDVPSSASQLSTDDPLSVDHQQRFYTGWGDDDSSSNKPKTPSLGLTWTNQLAARVALQKDPVYEDRAYQLGEDRDIIGWRRSAKVVFSAWCPESKTDYEIWEGGVRSISPANENDTIK